MHKNSWSGTKFHCPLCSSKLTENPELEEEEFDWSFDNDDDDYDIWLKNHPENYDDSAYYHCSSKNCFYHLNSLILFHPLGSYKSSAGDSWALGFPDHWWNSKIHCIFCSHQLVDDSNDNYHCSNNKCYYNFKCSLTLLHPQGSKSWAIGYIK